MKRRRWITPTQKSAALFAAGIETNHHHVGEGQPVLLIHGSGPGVSAYVNWRPTLAFLSERYRVIAPDIFGFRFTDRPAAFEYSMDRWLGHLVGVMDVLKIERAHVIGNSLGSALASALAIQQPAHVNRLVLMGSVGVRFQIAPELDNV